MENTLTDYDRNYKKQMDIVEEISRWQELAVKYRSQDKTALYKSAINHLTQAYAELRDAQQEYHDIFDRLHTVPSEKKKSLIQRLFKK